MFSVVKSIIFHPRVLLADFTNLPLRKVAPGSPLFAWGVASINHVTGFAGCLLEERNGRACGFAVRITTASHEILSVGRHWLGPWSEYLDADSFRFVFCCNSVALYVAVELS